MGYDQVPDDCLKGLRHGCHCLWIHGGDDNAHIRYLSGEATIPAHNSADSGTLQGEVGAPGRRFMSPRRLNALSSPQEVLMRRWVLLAAVLGLMACDSTGDSDGAVDGAPDADGAAGAAGAGELRRGGNIDALWRFRQGGGGARL